MKLITLVLLLFSICAHAYNDDCEWAKSHSLPSDNIDVWCKSELKSKNIHDFKNAFDTDTLSELNNEAADIWNELKKLGYDEDKYLKAEILNDKNLDLEIRGKVKGLKLQVATYITSTEFDYKTMLEVADRRLRSGGNNEHFSVHPLLSQLFIENLLLETSRGWIDDMLKNPDYVGLIHTISENLIGSSLFTGPIVESYFQKNQRIVTLAKNFIKNALLIHFFKSTPLSCSSTGLAQNWSAQALDFVYSKLEPSYRMTGGDSFEKVLFFNATSENCADKNNQKYDFVRSFNKLQARYK